MFSRFKSFLLCFHNEYTNNTDTLKMITAVLKKLSRGHTKEKIKNKNKIIGFPIVREKYIELSILTCAAITI